MDSKDLDSMLDKLEIAMPENGSKDDAQADARSSCRR